MPTHEQKTLAILGFVQQLKNCSAETQVQVSKELSDHPLSWKQVRKIRSLVGLDFKEEFSEIYEEGS